MFNKLKGLSAIPLHPKGWSSLAEDYMELWIARTKSGKLGLYNFKPLYNNIYDLWICKHGVLIIDKKLFPEVTFENSPKRVKIELV